MLSVLAKSEKTFKNQHQAKSVDKVAAMLIKRSLIYYVVFNISL